MTPRDAEAEAEAEAEAGGSGSLSMEARGGHKVMILENHYRTPDSEGLLNV